MWSLLFSLWNQFYERLQCYLCRCLIITFQGFLCRCYYLNRSHPSFQHIWKAVSSIIFYINSISYNIQYILYKCLFFQFLDFSNFFQFLDFSNFIFMFYLWILFSILSFSILYFYIILYCFQYYISTIFFNEHSIFLWTNFTRKPFGYGSTYRGLVSTHCMIWVILNLCQRPGSLKFPAIF